VYIAMELLLGQSLLDVATACAACNVRLPLPVLAWMLARAAGALHSAHGSCDPTGTPLEIIHRDVNPSNLFVTFNGRVKVIDFGLAKAKNRVSLTNNGIIKGKLAYLAPEQAQIHGPKIDRRTDVFALGLTLWELSLNRRLFKRDSDLATVRAVQAAEVPDPLSLDLDYPPALRKIVLRALSKRPADRYPTAAELGSELDDFARKSLTSPQRTVAALMDEVLAEEHGRQLAWFARAATKQETKQPLRVSLLPPAV
jgi:serine/threonine-protein kinase